VEKEIGEGPRRTRKETQSRKQNSRTKKIHTDVQIIKGQEGLNKKNGAPRDGVEVPRLRRERKKRVQRGKARRRLKSRRGKKKLTIYGTKRVPKCTTSQMGL